MLFLYFFLTAKPLWTHQQNRYRISETISQFSSSFLFLITHCIMQSTSIGLISFVHAIMGSTLIKFVFEEKNLRIITFYALDLLFTATAVRVSEEKISLQAIFAIFAIFSPSLVCSIVCSPSPDARKEESSSDQDQKNHFFLGKPHSWYSPPLSVWLHPFSHICPLSLQYLFSI